MLIRDQRVITEPVRVSSDDLLIMNPDTTPSDESDPGSEDTEAEYYVLGGGGVGAHLARRLHEAGKTVRLIDESYDCPTRPGERGDPTNLQILKSAEIPEDATIVVATRSDRQNLLIAQLVRAHFDVSRIVVLVNNHERLDAFADTDHEPVCATTALSDVLVETI